ncbi:CDP-diacylglycerol--glycerol-3-phosphate 3-phosphatidyltransferase [Desulfogranum japonicum]|uniref:CDP-diacylglycerol--glycerol-3-phosphate 3-phosphatidyltransferase n=1 Tax=Desulfogranum japonicum TaxID=231447 RepID=UPI000414B86D|nr:CDP-diacylglycerol--glycerol-3-phosphate 3-phosphatidyltransferase [Desulfogranum japonicum]
MKKPASKILTVPNIITGIRFLLSGLLAIFLIFEQTTTIALIAFVIFVIAAVSDWVDGYYARRYQAVTVLGKLMDPLADKVLVTTALVMLIPTGRLPAWVALVILCREIVVTGLRGVASSSGIVVAASGLGKLKSTFQYIGLGALIFPLGVLPIPALYQIGLFVVYIALILTVWSGLDYFYKLRRVFLED